MSPRSSRSKKTATKPRRTGTNQQSREMRHGNGRQYSASEQAKLPEPGGRPPQGSKPLAGYDIESKPKRRRRP